MVVSRFKTNMKTTSFTASVALLCLTLLLASTRAAQGRDQVYPHPHRKLSSVQFHQSLKSSLQGFHGTFKSAFSNTVQELAAETSTKVKQSVVPTKKIIEQETAKSSTKTVSTPGSATSTTETTTSSVPVTIPASIPALGVPGLGSAGAAFGMPVMSGVAQVAATTDPASTTITKNFWYMPQSAKVLSVTTTSSQGQTDSTAECESVTKEYVSCVAKYGKASRTGKGRCAELAQKRSECKGRTAVADSSAGNGNENLDCPSLSKEYTGCIAKHGKESKACAEVLTKMKKSNCKETPGTFEEKTCHQIIKEHDTNCMDKKHGKDESCDVLAEKRAKCEKYNDKDGKLEGEGSKLGAVEANCVELIAEHKSCHKKTRKEASRCDEIDEKAEKCYQIEKLQKMVVKMIA